MTVGGKSVAKRNGQIVVMAAQERKGNLSDLISVQSSAQADGTFTVAGLTPGVYYVQAALDGIWLSSSKRVEVMPEPPLGSLALDIGEPGGATVIKFVDAHDKPARGAVVSVIRPRGPLTERFWPATFVADGAGTLSVPPVEAGIHQIQVNGQTRKHKFTVARLSEASEKQTEIRIVIK